MSDPSMPGGIESTENLSTTIIAVTSVFTGLTVLCLILRFVSRIITGAGILLDDYLSLCATVFLIGIQVCVGIMAKNGIGRHATWLAEHPESAVTLGKAQLAFSFTYGTCQFFAKASALALLTRIFTRRDPLLRWGSYMLWVYVVLVFCASIIVTALQCRPLSTNWGVPHMCSLPPAASLSVNVLIATTDLFLVVLPQPSIWRLELDSGKKLGLSLILMIGLLGFIVAVARMVIVDKYQSSLDATYDNSNAFIFTMVEPACVIVCGCLPTIPKLSQAIGSWKGWSKLSAFVMHRRATNKGQLSQRTPSNCILATKSWQVLHSNRCASKGDKPSSASTESTERLDLGNAHACRTVYIGNGQV